MGALRVLRACDLVALAGFRAWMSKVSGLGTVFRNKASHFSSSLHCNSWLVDHQYHDSATRTTIIDAKHDIF